MSLLNPCRILNDILETKLSNLESIAALAQLQVNAAINSIEGYNDAVTSVENITNATNNVTTAAVGINTNAISDISTFSGSCLEDIFGKLSGIEKDISNTISDAMDLIPEMSVLPELPISKILKQLESLLGIININGLINEIDRLLGCLSDAIDLPDCQTEIVSAGARVDSVIANLKLTATGAFDFDEFTTGLATSAAFIANLKNIGTKVDDLSIAANTTMASVRPVIKVPPDYY